MILPNLMFKRSDLRQLNESQVPQSTRKDLNLNEFLNSLKAISPDFPVEYLCLPCSDINDANYRLDIMNELFLSKSLFSELEEFNASLKHYVSQITEYRDTKNEVQKSYRFLSLICELSRLVKRLNKSLSGCSSEGLSMLLDYTEEIVRVYFIIFEQAEKLEEEISCILKNNILSVNPNEKTITINKRDSKKDAMEHLSTIIKKCFGIDIVYSFSIVDPAQISVLEKKLLDILYYQNEDVFIRLNNFCSVNAELSNVIAAFSKLYLQFEFYLTYITLLFASSRGNMSICKPTFCNEGFFAQGCACPLLITKFLENKTELREIVCNDIDIKNGGMFILSGANQGGKTIYLKSIGLTAYLAQCGCLVFCKSCFLPFYDCIFTHFIQPEKLGRGRLAEEAERMEMIINSVSAQSLVLMNESFTSTRRKDGIDISIHYMQILKRIGCSVGFVSHYYELPDLLNIKEKCVESLEVGVSYDGKRTYRVLSNTGRGKAYAKDVALKCGITYEQMIEEFGGTGSD